MKLCSDVSTDYNRKPDLGFMKANFFWPVTQCSLFIFRNWPNMKDKTRNLSALSPVTQNN